MALSISMLPSVAITAPLTAISDALTSLADGPAVLGLLSALVAAVVTHLFTRRRGHLEWVRERQFETMGQLRDSARTFTYGVYEGIGLKGTSPGVFDSIPPDKHREWSDVDEAHRGYEKALVDLDMLTTHPGARRNMAEAVKAIRVVHADLRRARGNMDERGQFPIEVHRQLKASLDHFRSTHYELVERLRSTYFVNGAMPLRHRIYGWWLNRKDAIEARR